MRKKKLLRNTFSAMGNQLIGLVCGLILPRLILSHYGSAVNGLLSSITQFLAFFSMLEMGVGAVVRAALYKPLSAGDDQQISRILLSSRRFYRKIAAALGIYTAGLMVFFPLAVDQGLGIASTALLVGAVAFSSAYPYLFGTIYTQLLEADQRSYISSIASIITTLLNTALSVALIGVNAPIVAVKCASAAVFLLKPAILRLYVRRNYRLNLHIQLHEEPLKQKWNGLAQHIAAYVLKHADTVILTLFSTLENVSIYYVYHLVTSGLRQVVEILTTGMAALLGELYAREEKDALDKTFSAFEWGIHTLVTLIYSAAGVLILPFVRLYTSGVSDTNYILPIFSAVMVAANAAYCLRIPYTAMVNAAGHFRQTQGSAIGEAVLNVALSLLLVSAFGLTGVAVGTLAAMAYRTAALVLYLRKALLNRALSRFVKQLAVDLAAASLILLAAGQMEIAGDSWLGWALCAIRVCVTGAAVELVLNLLFFREQMLRFTRWLFARKAGQEV